MINAALGGVKDVVALSTDKACAPINLWCYKRFDKLFVAANNIKGSKKIKFSVVRYGNVMGSRGSVIPFFIKKKEEGVLPITHGEMTRFHISLLDGVIWFYMQLKIILRDLFQRYHRTNIRCCKCYCTSSKKI